MEAPRPKPRPVDVGDAPLTPTPPAPVRLPLDTIAAVVDRSRVEGLTRTATLVALVEYALRAMPRGWRP
jgi:hypothetical protein